MGVFNADQSRTALQVCFLLWIEHLSWWEALRCNKSLGWINWWYLQWWHQYIEQLRLEPVQISMSVRCENRCTVLPCTRTARGRNTSAADETNQFMDPFPRSMYGSSQSFNVNTIDFEQLVLVQFWLWVTTFFQRGTRPLFLLCLIWMGHVLCCAVFLNPSTNALHKHRQSTDICNFGNVLEGRCKNAGYAHVYVGRNDN